MDDVQIQGCPATPNTPTPDCNYSNVLANGYAYRAIPCTRDLQDFFRLWVCGINYQFACRLANWQHDHIELGRRWQSELCQSDH